jgi:hypothetical protein
VFSVHLFHNDIVLQLLRRLSLHALEHQVRLLEAALANLCGFFLGDAFIQVLDERP